MPDGIPRYKTYFDTKRTFTTNCQAKANGSRGVCQGHADLAQQQPLILAYDQEFETATQAVAITDHSPHLQDARREWNRELEGNNFTGAQFAAKGGADAVFAELVGPAPASSRQAIAKDRHLNARIKTMAGEAPLL